VLLLPGSRRGELTRHLPAMIGAARRILEAAPDTRFQVVLPDEELRRLAEGRSAALPNVRIQVGGLARSLQEASLVIAKTGTVTLVCALFGVPTVALYKTSWPTYLIARSIATVKFLAMPNLLAGDTVFPELIQHHATPESIAREALALLASPAKREEIRTKLAPVLASLGGPGASDRAAAAVLSLMDPRQPQ
jgi:lipid-A-disaccharide synthase